MKNVIGKRIFPLLFFEHGYLSNDQQCNLDNWKISSKQNFDLGHGFYVITKNGKLLCHFFVLFF